MLYLLPRTTVANDKQKEGIIKIWDGGCATHACERFSHAVHNRDTCVLVPLIHTPNFISAAATCPHATVVIVAEAEAALADETK